MSHTRLLSGCEQEQRAAAARAGLEAEAEEEVALRAMVEAEIRLETEERIAAARQRMQVRSNPSSVSRLLSSSSGKNTLSSQRKHRSVLTVPHARAG